jgi:hypothetical protein
MVRPLRGAMVVALLAPVMAGAQIVASERALVAQVVDGTRLTVDYSRPRARGRTNIYGGMEKWGRAWTPGADDATTLEFNRRTFEHTEVLTRDFPAVATTGTTLRMRWGGLGIEVPITVTPMYPVAISAEQSAPYVGTYDFAWTGDPTERFTVVARAGQLFGEWAATESGSQQVVQLVPNGTDQFIYGVVRSDELWAVNPNLVIRFFGSEGKVRSLEFRSGDRVMAEATRRDG